MSLCPILLGTIEVTQEWGGQMLQQRIGVSGDEHSPVAEQLQVIDSASHQSTIDTPTSFADWTLRELVADNPSAIVGQNHPADKAFPLQVSFMDTRTRRPLAVHPSSTLPSEPANAQAWFLLESQPNAQVFAGIKASVTQQQFLNCLGTNTFENVVQAFPAEPGDAYYLPSGRVHAIGAGNLIYAVRQNESPGRLLCTWNEAPAAPVLTEREQALQLIDFRDRTIARIRGESSNAMRNRKIPLLANSPLLSVDEMRIVEELHDRTSGASFHLLTAIDGSFKVSAQHGEVTLPCYRTCLIPAALGYYAIAPIQEDGEPRVMKILKSAMRAI